MKLDGDPPRWYDLLTPNVAALFWNHRQDAFGDAAVRRFTTAVHRRIQGLSSPWRADPVMFMDELWVDEGG